MMPLTLAPTTEIDSLPARLGRLRMRFRTILLVREGSRVGLLALFLLIAFGWLDWRYQLPSLVRACTLGASLTLLIFAAYFRLVRPWRRERTILAMAHRVERRFPELNDSLLSATQFLQEPDASRFGSDVMRRKPFVLRSR